MTRPDFTEWLGNPDSENVRLTHLGDLIDWAGSGLGGDNITRLLEECEQSCLEYHVDPVADMDICCLVAKPEPGYTAPWEILVGASLHSRIPDGDLFIAFSPITKDTQP